MKEKNKNLVKIKMENKETNKDLKQDIDKDINLDIKKRNYIIISGVISVFLVIFMHVYVRNLINSFLKMLSESINLLKEYNITDGFNFGLTREDLRNMFFAKIYWIRAILKILIFGFPMLIYILKKNTLKFLSFEKKINPKVIYLAFIILIGTFLGFYIIKDFLDMNEIKEKIHRVSISRFNYIFMYIYIFTINAFLEEVFFRGFLYLELKKYIKDIYANMFSSLLFGIYHIGIVGELSLRLGILSVVGLFAVGIVFNLVNKKRDNVYTSYILHASSNIAINTIGLIYAFM